VNTTTVPFRADWTLRDYIDFVPNRKAVSPVVLMVTDEIVHVLRDDGETQWVSGEVGRLHQLDITLTRDRASSVYFLVETDRADFFALVVDPNL
jgi:hypothetical protein